MFTYKRLIITALTALLMLGSSAFGLDLRSAKSQGLVGETASGYLAQVKSGNAEAARLVQDINAKRRAHYEKIAARNNTSLQAVEQLAGKKAIEKTPAGEFIKANGGWKKK